MQIRKFYGSGEAKGFSKRSFYEAVGKMAAGEELTELELQLVAMAAAYEIEGLDIATAKSAAGNTTLGTLEKPIAVDIITNLLPLLSDVPMTPIDLIDLSIQKGLVTSKGTNFANPWVNTILKALSDEGQIKRVTMSVEGTRTIEGNAVPVKVPKVMYASL